MQNLVRPLSLLFFLLPIQCFAQMTRSLKITAQMRETTIIDSEEWGQCIKDTSVFRTIEYHLGDGQFFSAEDYLNRYVDHLACPDTLLRSKNGQNRIAETSSLSITDFEKLWSLLTTSYPIEELLGRTFINNNFHLKIEIHTGSEDVILVRGAEEGDYVRTWFNENTGVRIINPVLDSIIFEVLPHGFIGSDPLQKIPVNYDLKLHEEQLDSLLQRFVEALKSGKEEEIMDLVKLISIDSETINYMRNKHFEYRSIPSMLVNNNGDKSLDFIEQQRTQVLKEIENFLHFHKDISHLLEFKEKDYQVGFFQDKLMPIEKIEMAEVVILVSAGDKKFTWVIGEMLRVNGNWKLFSDIRL